MIVLIWLLTAVLVVDCLFLVLLVLVQLPKKEAGAGMAFGGAATDALFGAGSGTALTKITKYAAGIFFVVALLLSTLNGQLRPGESGIEEKLKEKAAQTLPTATPSTTQPGIPGTTPPSQPSTPAVTPPAEVSKPEEFPVAPAPATPPAATETTPTPPAAAPDTKATPN